MTKQQLISDIILRVSAGKPADNLELEPDQVAFWIDQVLNALVKQTLDKRLQNGEGIDGDYINFQPNQQLTTDTLNGSQRYFLTLDYEPMNLYRDGGIIMVRNSDGLDVVNKTRFQDLDIISNLKFSTPQLKNIFYTRTQSTLYFYGVDLNSYNRYNFDIAYVPKTDALETLDDTDEIYVTEDIIPILAEQLETMARREVLGVTEDRSNDANQNSQARPSLSQKSPNQ